MPHHDDYPYRGGPPDRWDGDRFARERSGRAAVMERDRFEERDRYTRDDRGVSHRREISEDDYHARRGGGYEDDRLFYEREERYGPPARRSDVRIEEVDRRYYEEDEFDNYEDSPRRFGGRRAAPPRPGMLIRRQSSLDTFDRKPPPRYHEPEVITVPSPRGGRGPERRHRYEPRYAERDEFYEDIRVAEPDRYGDDDFRGWKEREVETIRRRRPASPLEEVREREVVEEVVEEKPWPRKGRTRMSARLVNKRALVHLGYPYEDDFTDDGDYVIILKALNKELIDEVLGLSKDFNVKYSLEGPKVQEETIIERKEVIVPDPVEVPRSVREWDVMSGTVGGDKKSEHLTVRESVAGSKHSRRSKSAHGARSEHDTLRISEHRSSRSRHGRRPSRGESTTIKITESREGSPVVVERKRSKSRRRRSSAKAEVIDQEVGESNSMHPGPLALVVPHFEKRDTTKEEILELESEKRRLRRERRRERKYHSDSDGEIIIERRERPRKHRSDSEDEVIIERRERPRKHRSESEEEVIIERRERPRKRHSDSEDEIIIERRRSRSGDRRESVKVEKDRKDSKVMKAMLATLT